MPPMSDGFIKLPWASTLRGETDFYIPPNWLAVYPVMLSFANMRDGYTFPSARKIAILAGIRQESVKLTIESLIDNGWLRHVATPPQHIHAAGNVYQVIGRTDGRRKNVFIGRSLIRNGAWGEMPKSARALYCSMKALSVIGEYAISAEVNGQLTDEQYDQLDDDFIDERNGFDWQGERGVHFLQIGDDEIPVTDFSFLPLAKSSPKYLQQIAHIQSDRTFRDAKAWLHIKELVLSHPKGLGYIMPLNIQYSNRQILDALDKVTVSNQNISPEAKRSLSFAKNRQIRRKSNE